MACPFIGEQLVAFLTAAFEGAHCVPAEVIAAAVVLLAFINVWVEEIKGKQSDGHSISPYQTVISMLMQWSALKRL